MRKKSSEPDRQGEKPVEQLGAGQEQGSSHNGEAERGEPLPAQLHQRGYGEESRGEKEQDVSDGDLPGSAPVECRQGRPESEQRSAVDARDRGEPEGREGGLKDERGQVAAAEERGRETHVGLYLSAGS